MGNGRDTNSRRERSQADPQSSQTSNISAFSTTRSATYPTGPHCSCRLSASQLTGITTTSSRTSATEVNDPAQCQPKQNSTVSIQITELLRLVPKLAGGRNSVQRIPTICCGSQSKLYDLNRTGFRNKQSRFGFIKFDDPNSFIPIWCALYYGED
jgi:hypothetical protein